jgi:hypothetical protein
MSAKCIASYSSLLLLSLVCGCYTAKVSEPPRTALEQMLLSRAADLTMEQVDFTWLRGKKVFVEEKYFESYDKGYAISLIRQRISQDGGLLMSSNINAEVIVEIRSGGLGMSTSEALIGLPALTVPVPFSGAMQTPEIALYKNQTADSMAKFALFAYRRETGENLRSVWPVSGYAHFRLYKILGIAWRRTDVPQLMRHPLPKSNVSSSKRP